MLVPGFPTSIAVLSQFQTPPLWLIAPFYLFPSLFPSPPSPQLTSVASRELNPSLVSHHCLRQALTKSQRCSHHHFADRPIYLRHSTRHPSPSTSFPSPSLSILLSSSVDIAIIPLLLRPVNTKPRDAQKCFNSARLCLLYICSP